MSRTKNITLGISAAALAVGLGLGVTTMASATTSPTPAPSKSASVAPADGKGKHGGHKGEGNQLAAALAAKLGVDEAQVTEAFKAFKEANRPATKPAEGTKPDHASKEAALAKSLAAALGVDEAKVSAALTEVRTAARTERGTAELKARLDKAVADGTLTQAEADAVTKAAEKGVLHGGKGKH